MGGSGCGKGTQAKILERLLQANEPNRPIFHLETGTLFRKFIKEDSYSSKLSKEINEVGGRQPDFLAVWNWSHHMIEELTGIEHILIDGTPRSYEEARVLDSAMTFYRRERPYVIYIDVSREWSKKRILERAKDQGRTDDQTEADVTRRLDWFKSDVMPAIKFFEQTKGYRFIHIDGEQSIEKVAEDIQKSIIA